MTAFIVKALSSGTLKIGTSAGTATAWHAVSNNTIDATHQAYWTPATNTNGTLNAFTVVAKDNGGLESASAVQAAVSITALNDAADQAGYDAWMQALDSGAISREGVLIGFSESTENKIALTGATENGIEYQAWL